MTCHSLNINMRVMLQKAGAYEAAFHVAEQGYAHAIHEGISLYQNHFVQLLVELASQSGNKDKEASLLKAALLYADSLRKSQHIVEVAELDAIHREEEREIAIQALEKENAKQSSKISFLNAAIGAALLIAFILLVIYIIKRKQQKRVESTIKFSTYRRKI